MPDRRWTEREMLELAARGLGKIDRLGERGLTLVGKDELAAMAGVLAALGLVPIPPGAAAPADLFIIIQGGAA